MRVVVTGGAGFIGANLCRALSRDPSVESLVAIDDYSTGRQENLAGLKDVAVVESSILDRDTMIELTEDADVVVHLAARPSVPRSLADPEKSHEVNATGTVRVLEAARRSGRPHVIVASSSSVYGASAEIPKREEMVATPVSPYAASKLAAESYALAYSRSFGLPVLALRFFNVFGPLQDPSHDYAAVVPTFVSAAIADRPLPVHGDGRQTRDFTYVGSVVTVLADAIRRRVTSDRPVNLAFGGRVSLLELIATLERQVGHSLVREHDDPRPGDVSHSQADTSGFERLFPGVSRVSLDDGLALTINWMRDHLAEGVPVAHTHDRASQ
jgi:UDP-glucose 4-epimerase